VVVVLAPLAIADPGPSVTGALKRDSGAVFGETHAIVSVHQSGDGDAATGQYQRQIDPGTKYMAEAFCIRVSGNTAVTGVTITSSNEPSHPVGSSLFVFWSDNGNGNGQDAVSEGPLFTGELPDCPPPNPAFERITYSGNITING
jgi:hypothetical protein